MIRAYVPWYLVRNYLTFAFVACLGALHLAAAHSGAVKYRRARYTIAFAVLVGAFLSFYVLAPELLTPGPAGGEMVFLFGGAALPAIVVTRQISDLRCRVSERIDQPLPSAVCRPPSAFFGTFGLSLVVIFFDVPLFHLLNNLALRTPLIDVPMQFLMNDSIVPTALVLALLALWFAGRDAGERMAFQHTVLRALLSLALASVALKLINEVYFRPRPFTFDDSVRLLFYHPSDSSMPSNAATVCFALAVPVWLRNNRWGWVMLALGAGMTLARVVGGVHYPADVVAGAWLGGLAACLVNRMTWLGRLLNATTYLARRMGLG